MIDKDEVYQRLKRPQRQPSEQTPPDSINDPHASFVRRHIINAVPTGNDAFDELHKELAPLVAEYRSTRRPRRMYNSLISLAKSWENNHPGQKFFPRKRSQRQANH
jgi:hypothetical protein